MGARGVHFALSPAQTSQLLAAAENGEAISVIEEIEEVWDREFFAESDKAWDAIHRCLTDGDLLYDNGEYPLSHVICGGQQLSEDENYTISFVTIEQVKDVARALISVTKPWLREEYFSLLKEDEYAAEIGDEDFEYTWDWFENVHALYQKAASAGRAVVFTVDS